MRPLIYAHRVLPLNVRAWVGRNAGSNAHCLLAEFTHFISTSRHGEMRPSRDRSRVFMSKRHVDPPRFPTRGFEKRSVNERFSMAVEAGVWDWPDRFYATEDGSKCQLWCTKCRLKAASSSDSFDQLKSSAKRHVERTCVFSKNPLSARASPADNVLLVRRA